MALPMPVGAPPEFAEWVATLGKHFDENQRVLLLGVHSGATTATLRFLAAAATTHVRVHQQTSDVYGAADVTQDVDCRVNRQQDVTLNIADGSYVWLIPLWDDQGTLRAFDGATGPDQMTLVDLIADIGGTGPWNFNEYIDLNEILDPGPPAADTVRIYAADEQGFPVIHLQDATGRIFDIARDTYHVVRNNSGVAIGVGEAVYVSGSQGTVPTVEKARADSSATMPAFGLAAEDIPDSSFGRILTAGDLGGVDTSAFTEGDVLYVSATTAGALTATPPRAFQVQQMAVATKIGAGAGGIFSVADDRFGDEIGDIGNVSVTAPAAGAFLQFDGSQWVDVLDGAGSGFDADLLDGEHGAFYQDAANLIAGVLADARVQQSNVVQHQGALAITESQISDLDHYSLADLLLEDGAGSGLDADLLDGQHAAAFAAASHGHVEADISDLDHFTDADADARIALATLASLASASASDIDGGTLADARLSANVPLLDAANVFTDTMELRRAAALLTLVGTASSAALIMTADAGNVRDIRIQSGGSNRWVLRVDQTAETGSNAGSDLEILRRADNGSALGTSLSIERATGIVTLGISMDVSAGVFSNTDQTGVAVTAAAIHQALVNLGLITA